ncbi:DUF3545 family protein [Gallaecimonas pentaromativorans]|uniref:Uncharacterized protein DUF3545 n=1 Tax=Gallaecimonas pentaromativorans TaxID=584787 RepID=A0A3N1PNZ8_9GAMM|nr:DUF3545 family protein [Gallaecimonas pentaromativorans]MED5524707.1 DUF3545 family protein [Pseudomonadota bacterium]ROQ28697.1 uncharacterized protein DUF3545 [Gallaecimonas pentaromativorans]
MEDIQDLQLALTGGKRDAKGRGASNKKRRWREIEDLKEKYRLKRELEEIDWNSDYSLDRIDL